MSSNPHKGKVFIFSAPSGAGKTTIVKRVLQLHPDFSFSVSATTRPKRELEQNGIDYYFLTEPEFKSKIKAGDFLEWEEVYPGRFYGTLKTAVDHILTSGNSVVFDVDVQGGVNIKRYYGDSAVAFFIQPPSLDTLRNRLESRGTESKTEIDKRMSKAAEELTMAPQFDFIILNDQLEPAVAEIEKIIQENLL